MIWTVVLWLGMQGQRANEPNAAILVEPNVICNEWLPDSHGSCDAAPTQFKPLKSAEHVFEIRTKRDESAPIKNEYLIGCREGFTLIQSEHVSGDVWTTEGCVRITRELWIDGKRLGTIKGLD